MEKIKEVCPECHGKNRDEDGNVCDYCKDVGYHFKYVEEE
jgi:cytochrome c1